MFKRFFAIYIGVNPAYGKYSSQKNYKIILALKNTIC